MNEQCWELGHSIIRWRYECKHLAGEHKPQSNTIQIIFLQGTVTFTFIWYDEYAAFENGTFSLWTHLDEKTLRSSARVLRSSFDLTLWCMKYSLNNKGGKNHKGGNHLSNAINYIKRRYSRGAQDLQPCWIYVVINKKTPWHIKWVVLLNYVYGSNVNYLWWFRCNKTPWMVLKCI